MIRRIIKVYGKRYAPLLACLLFLACPENDEDALMLHIYHSLNEEIASAVEGTEIPAEYLAALISLESHPAGNRDSQRFEPGVYERLLDLKYSGEPFGYIPRNQVQDLSDDKIHQLATSYGLTQIMGYHCLQLGCSIDDLKGEFHLMWAVAYIREHYGKKIAERDWEACFRIHNTGRADGTTSRKDYVERGLKRMEYYHKWMEKQGSVL
ncbi:MAG: hypothetical protein KDK37_04590 [Leptospiraceae bacterium]|nr:hypothetical protein [Leptospiraceae bacterium]MCB1303526.1 hypothetical protein [Leptospiraceae bacterium]